MKKLSEQFIEMSQQTAAWEKKAAAYHTENRKEFEADVADARKAVQSAQVSFDAKLNNIEEPVSLQWRKVQESFDKQVATARRKATELKVAHNLAEAEDRAAYYEDYAEVAADFARLAATEADAAMLSATEARAEAESLAKTTA